MRTKINQLKKQLKNERGLTLVELLAVIVILAIIAVIAFVMIGNVMENAKKDAHIENARQLIGSAKLYDTTVESIDSEIGPDKLTEAGLLEPLMDPWDKEEYTTAKVEKDGDGVYSVTLVAKGDDKCPINQASEEKLKK